MSTQPTNESPEAFFTSKMRSLAAEGSAGDGGVVATVNGYGALVGMRIAPEMLTDVTRLEGLVTRAVNRGKEEARRQAPPPPLPRLPPGPAVIDLTALPLARSDGTKPRREYVRAWRASLERLDEAHREALRDAVAPIRERMTRDACIFPRELWPLFLEIDSRLGDPRLTAYSVRRGAGVLDTDL